MKVICTGMPKCGTKSLASALRTLGYNVYDFEEQFCFLGEDLIQAVESGWSTEDIRRIYKDADAVTDGLGNLLWEEIHRAFPEAKVKARSLICKFASFLKTHFVTDRSHWKKDRRGMERQLSKPNENRIWTFFSTLNQQHNTNWQAFKSIYSSGKWVKT